MSDCRKVYSAVSRRMVRVVSYPPILDGIRGAGDLRSRSGPVGALTRQASRKRRVPRPTGCLSHRDRRAGNSAGDERSHRGVRYSQPGRLGRNNIWRTRKQKTNARKRANRSRVARQNNSRVFVRFSCFRDLKCYDLQGAPLTGRHQHPAALGKPGVGRISRRDPFRDRNPTTRADST